MNITDARSAVIASLSATLPGIPIYGAPPGNVTPPCAYVALGGSSGQPTMNRWDAELSAVIVAPGGDNQAAVEWLEAAILNCARQLAYDFLSQIRWDEPGQLTIANSIYFGARLRVPIDLEG